MSETLRSALLHRPGAIPAVLMAIGVVACESPQPPAACQPIPQVTVNAKETATVTACFNDPNGDMLSYSVMSSNPGVATASSSGATVTVTAVSPGSASITVTAADPGGLQGQQSFQVLVPNRAPQPRGAMPSMTVAVGRSEAVDASSYFAEPDGEALGYSAASSDNQKATVSVAGSMVTVTALAKGTVAVTVTARDPGGLTGEQTFQVTVPNRAPEPVGTIADVEVEVDGSATVDVAGHFRDPDGDVLTYSAASSSMARAEVSVSGSVVTVTGVAKGSATVTVTAEDTEGLTARQTFRVTVPNRAPVAVGTIEDREVEADAAAEVDVARYFTDPDGDRLTYAAESSGTQRVAVSVSGSVVTVRGVAKGSATVTVTAEDTEGLTARQTFRVTVPNRAPVAVGTIEDIEVVVDSAVVLDMSDYFSDPDGDVLTHSATSSNSAVADVSVAGTVMRLVPVAAGNATVTVTARDPEGLAARQQANVTVIWPDREVLVALYEATGGPNWRNNENWLSDAPLGEWYGVQTDGTGRVVRLDLSGGWDANEQDFVDHGLEGSIPPELGDLASLAVLDLGFNDLSGAIPLEIWNLGRIEHLDFGSNDLSGPIPRQLGGLDRIEYLSLRGNDLSGPIPPEIGSLKHLRRLRLGWNGLSGAIPPEIGNLGSLVYLELSDNDLTGSIPPELGNLTNLRVLHLKGNSLTGSIPPELGNLGSLVDLSLSDNDLSGAIPRELGNLGSLEELWLDSNSLTGLIPSALGNLADLERLWLRENDLSGPLPPEIGNLAHLWDLLLQSNPRLAGSIPLAYQALSLNTFQWYDTGLCSPDDSSFQAWLGSIRNHIGGPVCRKNRAPEAVGTIPDRTMTEGDTVSLDIESYFTDPDGDELTYSVESSRPTVARASMSGSTVTVVAVVAGTATMTVTATDPGDLSATQTFGVTVSATESFDMEMRFTSSVSSTVRSHVTDARDEWEAVLEDTELDDITVNRTLSCHGLSGFVGTVDDHLILVHVDSIDGEGGVLAYAGYCYFRRADDSPLLSATWIDEADVEDMMDQDALVPVMFHEMAHALGFSGGHWDKLELLEKGDDPHFEGELAIEAFDEAGGEDYDGEKVPVQLTVYSHWRESVFEDEIMTPSIDLDNDEVPISAITLQAMADAGYEVDVSRADDYELPGSDDIQARRRTGRVLDLSNDVVWGPVTVLDADGRVIRVIPPPPGAVRWPFNRRDVPVEPRRPPGSGPGPK